MAGHNNKILNMVTFTMLNCSANGIMLGVNTESGARLEGHSGEIRPEGYSGGKMLMNGTYIYLL